MTATTGTRIADDGATLFTRHWPVAEPHAAVVLVHGLAEHSGRYEHVGHALAERGFDVRATDLRGFGRSEGRRAYIESLQTFVDDLEGDITEAHRLAVPVVLLGHSLGGAIATRYAQSSRAQPDLLVLSAPAIDAEVPKVKELAARVLSRILPRLQVGNGLKGDQLSRDPSVGERYFSDPLVHPKTTARFGMVFLEAMERARAELTSIDLPVLVIHGGDDPLVPPTVSAAFERLPRAHRVVFPEFRHESFNEDAGDVAITTVADWIDSQL